MTKWHNFVISIFSVFQQNNISHIFLKKLNHNLRVCRPSSHYSFWRTTNEFSFENRVYFANNASYLKVKIGLAFKVLWEFGSSSLGVLLDSISKNLRREFWKMKSFLDKKFWVRIHCKNPSALELSVFIDFFLLWKIYSEHDKASKLKLRNIFKNTR